MSVPSAMYTFLPGERVEEPPREAPQYSRVARRGLTSEEQRNVSGSTGRIPQPCVTGSLL